ncbi:MAG: gliding motility lipoprotein GldH [Lentimicrobiaceae bacterium]|jgi:gliding motility-associated lipoprotein GldH|nr:gliding motility lipoprotein GldH [Lentimicrobiaceae bacterium]
MKRVSKNITSCIVITIALFFGSCGNKSFYNTHVPIEKNSWDKNQSAFFELTTDDTVSVYACSIHIRHLETYRYSNLYLFLNTTFPNGLQTHDTIECILALPDGKWLSKSSGSLREIALLLNPALRFPMTGTYVFEIEQAMRDEVLEGVSDIGLKIDYTK